MQLRIIVSGVFLLTASIVAAAPAVPLESGALFRDCPSCPQLVVIPAGSFVMGTLVATDEVSEHPAERELTMIRIGRPFALGRYEITRREFLEFADDTGTQQGSDCRVWDYKRSRFLASPSRDWRQPEFPAQSRADHPMICVDWHDARAYGEWLSRKTGERYHLPSEAQWEYAAKAGTQTLRFWGNAPFEGCDFANTFDLTAEERYPLAWPSAPCRDGHADLAPVGTYQPNEFGLYDMIGNVWEWAEDCSSRSYVGRPKDAMPWVWEGCSRRIQRGGGWITAPARSRSAYHGDGRSTDRSVFFGFRVAREINR